MAHCLNVFQVIRIKFLQISLFYQTCITLASKGWGLHKPGLHQPGLRRMTSFRINPSRLMEGYVLYAEDILDATMMHFSCYAATRMRQWCVFGVSIGFWSYGDAFTVYYNASMMSFWCYAVNPACRAFGRLLFLEFLRFGVTWFDILSLLLNSEQIYSRRMLQFE